MSTAEACGCSCHASSPLLPTSPASKEVILSTIDRQIKQVEKQLQTLLEQRNTLIPVNNLPPEVLSQIFVHIQRTTSRFDRRWIALAHVCREWRSIAHITSYLWTSLDYDADPQLLEGFVQRAHSLPLSIKLSASSIDRIGSSTPSQPVLRARFIHISVGSPEDASSIYSFLRDLCPELRYLAFEVRPYSADVTIPPELRNLRTLSIRDSGMGWGANQWTNLLALDVRCSAKLPSCSSFQEGLNCLTQLELLILHYTIPAQSHWAQFERPSVVLPNLRWLEIHDMVEDTTQFLRCLEIPLGASLGVTIRYRTRAEFSVIQGLFESALVNLFHLGGIEFGDLAIELNKGIFNVLGWVGEPGTNPPSLDVALSHDTDDVSVLRWLIYTPITSQAKTLRIHSSHEFEEADVPTMAPVGNKSLSKLRTVYAGGPSSHKLLRCIDPSTCPSLSMLNLAQGHMEHEDIRSLESILQHWNSVGLRQLSLHIGEGYDYYPAIEGNVVHVPVTEGGDLSKQYGLNVQAIMDAIAEDDR